MTKALVDRLASIAALTPSKAPLARERLPEIVEYAEARLAQKVKSPSIKSSNRKLTQVQSDIKRLQAQLRDVSERDLIHLHQLKQQNWAQIRGLDTWIWQLQDNLSRLSQTLEQSKLAASKHRHSKQHLKDIVATCGVFFLEFSERDITAVETSPFSEFVHELLRALGHKNEVTWIIRSFVDLKSTRRAVENKRLLRQLQTEVRMEAE